MAEGMPICCSEPLQNRRWNATVNASPVGGSGDRELALHCGQLVRLRRVLRHPNVFAAPQKQKQINFKQLVQGRVEGRVP